MKHDCFVTFWGHTYYFGTDGARYTNQWSPDKKYYFGSDGHVKIASPVTQTNSVSVASDK